MDIEDLGKISLDINQGNKDDIIIKREFNDEICETNLSNGIPISKKIFIKTWGCSHNNSDGEYMAGKLNEEGYHIIDDNKMYDADLWILNGCTVKDPSQNVFDKHIKLAINKGIKLVLAGCVPQAEPNNNTYKNYSIIGIHQINRIGEVVEETLNGNKVQLFKRLKKDGGNELDMPKIRRNNLIETIPINTGCLNNCTYCKTKFARGKLNSYKKETILNRVTDVIKDGVLEIRLTSEDLGTYGKDIDENLPSLIWDIINLLPNNVMLRLGMTNPPYIIEHINEIIKILQHPRVYSFIHLPVQSGSDKILQLMKREYKLADFKYLVDKLIENIPDIHIATDIICGFPNETEYDFIQTYNLINKYKFITLNISQYSARKGTPAARMKQIDNKIKKKRSKKITELDDLILPFNKYIGTVFDVLCTEESFRGNRYVAHNKFYHHILIPKNPKYMGTWLTVKITKCNKYYMEGEIVNNYYYVLSIFAFLIFYSFPIILLLISNQIIIGN